MPRVTSKKTRQAILVVEGAIDLLDPPERLALFDAEGNSLSTTLRARGAWSATSSYIANDVATFGGQTYRAKSSIAANIGNLNPSLDEATWELLAAKGANGADGINGLPGINWRGTWNSGNTYAANDAVTANGSSWRAIRAIGAGGTSPDTPYGLVPGSSAYAGQPTEAWASGTNRSGSIATTNPIVSGRYVKLYRIPIATPGNVNIFAEYNTEAAALELYNSAGGLVSSVGAAGNFHSSVINTAVVAGTYYLVVRSSSGFQTVANYSVAVTFSSGATFGTDGQNWELVAQKGADGAAGAAGAGFNFQGLYVAATPYVSGAVVRNNNALYIATRDVTTSDPAPGAADTASFTGTNAGDAGAAYTAARTHQRLTTALQNWSCGSTEATFAYFFFDVTVAGTLTVDKEGTTGLGYKRLYRTSDGGAFGSGTTDYTGTFPVGRWYVRIEPNALSTEAGTIKLILGTAQINMGSNPWTLMLQGVA